MAGGRSFGLGLVALGALFGRGALSAGEPPGRAPPPAAIHARSRTTWIYPEPRVTARPLGYVRAGHSLPLRGASTARGAGCRSGWAPVEPRGFVCLDGASLGAPPRYARALGDTLGDARPLDFAFAWSNGAPAFRRLPSPEEAALLERAFGKPRSALPASSAPGGRLALLELTAPSQSGPLPWFLQAAGSARRAHEPELVREIVPQGSLIAYTRKVSAGGRDWLLRTDGTLVSAERVRPFRRSSFRGKKLERGLSLPLFWLRDADAPKYVFDAAGPHALRQSWPRFSAVALDRERRSLTSRGKRYLRTRELGLDGAPLYVRADAATVVESRVTPPAGVGAAGKWLRFSISKGTLVAYEGRRAVFTTLASPGAGGVPAPGSDPLSRSSTPLGTFRINAKHLSDDMGPEAGPGAAPAIAEVPYAQYFAQPFAIHVAYWHESFGRPMSGGCINVSPLDGQYLFEWTLPSLPPGWDAVVAGGEHGAGTLVHVVP